MTVAIEDFAQRIASKVGTSELAAARALGYSERAAFKSAFRALDETYFAVFAPERAPVRTTFRPMVKR